MALQPRPAVGSTQHAIPAAHPRETASQARLGAVAARGSDWHAALAPAIINCMARGESLHLLACFLLCTALITIQPSEPEINGKADCVYILLKCYHYPGVGWKGPSSLT